MKLQNGQITEIQYHSVIETALDTGSGPTFLREPSIARIVAAAILKFDGEKYELRNWVIMPNHVHLLFRTIEPYKLSQVMHSIKGFTASAANRLLRRSGRCWSPDYFDRFIRDSRHLANVNRY